jgi:hypothetical protein
MEVPRRDSNPWPWEPSTGPSCGCRVAGSVTGPEPQQPRRWSPVARSRFTPHLSTGPSYGGVQPGALEPAPCPSMGCRVRWRSSLARVAAAAPWAPAAPLACVRGCRGALSYSGHPRQDSLGSDLIGGRSRASPSVHRTSALCLSLRYVSSEPKGASDPGPEARQSPAGGGAALDGRGAVRRPRNF